MKMLNNISLVSVLFGIAIGLLIFNLINMLTALYKRKAARKRLGEAKKRMGEIDKELKEKQKELEDILKKGLKK